MRKNLPFFYLLILLVAAGCTPAEQPAETKNPLETYVATPDPAYAYEAVSSMEGDGYTQHVLRMTSQTWLTTSEVEDPTWWHWVTIVVPDEVQHTTGIMIVGGGSRNSDAPSEANPLLVQTALSTGTVAADVHNIPNQPMTFVGDDFGPRVEDELIAYGWRQYLDSQATDADAKWLARLPMTKAVVRAMDAVTEYVAVETGATIDQYVVAGGSKRGWTTWTTAAVDERVIGIVPIVIDMLNVVPSFEHHWQAYGFWAPAVGDYVREGIMERQQLPQYASLTSITEPYSYRERLTLPKLLINATGDQFFLPDSWQFYWDGLQGEKYLRYMANGEHSLSGTDALESLIAFHHSLVTETPRPEFDWRVENGTIILETAENQPPASVTVWQATNTDMRDFRVDTIGRSWTSEVLPLADDGRYEVSVDAPETGWTAFFVELMYPGVGDFPLKFSTGVVVTPEMLPYPPFDPNTSAD